MELGVDIAELNVVNMRNAPPTPANYAQRSGRAGRSGQPALVFTYCAAGSAHDQYFFRRPDLLVSGQVVTPRLELANEDLVRSHVQAVWLSSCGMSLGSSLKDILDLNHDDLPLLASIEDQLRDPAARRKARERCRRVSRISTIVCRRTLVDDDWLVDVLHAVPLEFERACERCGTSPIARQQRDVQHAIISALEPQQETQANDRARGEQQLERLVASDGGALASDFYATAISPGRIPAGYEGLRCPVHSRAEGRFRRSEYGTGLASSPSRIGPRTFGFHEGSRYRIIASFFPVGGGR